MAPSIIMVSIQLESLQAMETETHVLKGWHQGHSSIRS